MLNVSPLAYDRMKKTSLYASPESRIVNRIDRCLELHLEPQTDPTAPFGHSYRIRKVLGASDTISDLMAPPS